MFKATRSMSKATPGSDHDVSQVVCGRNIYATFELLLVYSYRDIAWLKWQSPSSHPA